MTLRYGLPLKAKLTDSSDGRFDFRSLVTCNADGTPRSGVTSPIGGAVIQQRSDMNVNILPLSGWTARDQGVVLLANDGAGALVAIPAAPASGSRFDAIFARQDDNSSTVSAPDADNTAKFYVISGAVAASGTPSMPAIPDGSLYVGGLINAAGNTSTQQMTLSSRRIYTAAVGGPVPFTTLQDMQGWTTAAIGQLAYVFADATPANNVLFEYTGATNGWQSVTMQYDTLGETEAAVTGYAIPTAAGAFYAAMSGKVVITLLQQTRVKVRTRIRINGASATGATSPSIWQLAYIAVPGNSTQGETAAVNSTNFPGYQQPATSAQEFTTIAGGPGQKTFEFERSMLLAAGTWSLIPVIASTSNGGNYSGPYLIAEGGGLV